MPDPASQRSSLVAVAVVLFSLVVAIGLALFLVIWVQWPGPWRWILAAGVLIAAGLVSWRVTRRR